jgi:hypothetical protein
MRAMEIRIRAEYRAGELLTEREMAKVASHTNKNLPVPAKNQ